MKPAPSVYAVVVAWNHSDQTVECLDSLARSSYPNLHLVLVDNASQDDTLTRVRAHFPHVHIIENQENLGFAEGNNAGLRYALAQGADFVFLLNADAAVTPSTLDELVRVAHDEPRAGMLFPTIISWFDHSRRYIAPDFNWQVCQGVERTGDPSAARVSDAAYAPGCALLAHASVVREISLLDAGYFAYFEDVDWSLRCKRAGYRVLYVPQGIVYHRGTEDQTPNKSPAVWYYYRRNQRRLVNKFAPFSYRLRFNFWHASTCLRQYARFHHAADLERAEAVLNGWWASLTGVWGPRRARAPRLLRQLLREHPGAIYWLIQPIVQLRTQLHRRPPSPPVLPES